MYEQIDSWEKLCDKLGHDPKVLPDVSMLPEKEAEFTLNCFKARMIANAYNKVDQENGEEGKPKYLPYFYKSAGGFSFDDVDGDAWFGYRNAAAGLCFITENGAESAGKLYVKVYEAID